MVLNDIISCAAAAAANYSSFSSSFSLPIPTSLVRFLHSRGGSSSCVHIPSELLRDFATREFNAFLWLSLVAVTTLLLTRLFSIFWLWHRARTIPGPPSNSFFGHCKLFSRQNLTFNDVLSESHQKYGTIVKLWLGPTQLLVSVRDPALIQEMLIKAEDKLPFIGKVLHLAFGESSLFAHSFEKVKKRRELLANELHERLLKNDDVIPMKVADFITDKIENIRTKRGIDSGLLSQHMAFTMMGATFFGDGFLASPKAAIYEELFMMIAKDACFWASYSVTPFWRSEFWRYQGLCTKLKCLTQDILQHFRKGCKLFGHTDQDGAQCCSDDKFQDYYFFRDLKDHRDGKQEPCGNIMRLIFHGCQTTSALITNILTMLVMHLEIQDKVYSEISMVGRNPSKYVHEDVYRMPLLWATIFESARLLPTSPMLQRCSLKHDVCFATGVTIPAGAVLVVPVELVQKDESSWGSDASDFNPYRFLSTGTKGSGSAEDLSFVLNDPNENAAFLPFGSGTRACIGQKFIIQLVASVLASLLKKYEIRLDSVSDDDTTTTLKNNNLLIQHHPNSQILFVKRDQ